MPSRHIHVCRYEAANCRVVVARLEVVQPGLRVVVIPTIPEGVVLTECGCQGAGNSEGLAPAVIRIAYHNRAGVVHQTDDVVLSVAHVVVFRAVVVHGDEIAARVIGVELLDLPRAAARYLRHEQTAVVAVVRHHVVHGFAGADALLVIGIARGRAVAREGGEALALPGHGKSAVGQRVSDRIVGDRLSVVACQQIAPSGVVGVGNRVRRRTERARSVVVLVAREDIAGEIVGVGRRAVGKLIVRTDELVHIVVHIGGRNRAARDRRDVAVGIVRIGIRVFATVAIRLHHAGLGAVRARKIGECDGVRRGEAIGAVRARTRGIVRVGDRLAACGDGHRAVVRVVGVLGGPVAARSRLIQFREVVVQIVIVAVLAAVAGTGTNEATAEIIEERRGHIPHKIHQTLEIAFTIIGIGVHRSGAERHAGDAVKLVR